MTYNETGVVAVGTVLASGFKQFLSGKNQFAANKAMNMRVATQASVLLLIVGAPALWNSNFLRPFFEWGYAKEYKHGYKEERKEKLTS